jgi:hypothetical protein
MCSHHVSSCSQVFNVFPKGVPNSWGGGCRGGFCFKLYLSGLSSAHLDSRLSMQVLLGRGGGLGGGFVFLSANGKAQGALLLLLLSLGAGKDFFFSFFPVSQCVPTMFPLSS